MSSKTDFKMIAVKNLSVVWPQTQRPLDETWARKIADNMDPDQLDPLLVTRANGNGIYHVIDGQHRVAAFKMCFKDDNQQMPCRIVDVGYGDHAEAVAKAAKLFYNLNTNRRRPMPVDLFKVGVEARLPIEVGVSRIITATGHKISTAQQDGAIACVSALSSIYKRHDAEVLRATLVLLQQIWGKDKNAFTAALVRGFGAFVAEHGSHIDIRSLIEKVAKSATPGRFLGMMRTRRESDRVNLTEAAVRILVDIYNKGRKSGKI